MALQLDNKKQGLGWWRWLLVLVLLGLIVATGVYTFRWYMYGDKFPVEVPVFVTADPEVDESEVTEQHIKEHIVPTGSPRYLNILKLGVSQARVFAMGVTAEGALAAPANISDIAWYDQSAAPGSGGVSLMNGHNGGIARDGVLSKLGSLVVGDIIEVERGDGEVFKYQVRQTQSMELSEVNESGMAMMSQSFEPGVEALNLITCDGKWVPRYGQFDRRIMLRATLVE